MTWLGGALLLVERHEIGGGGSRLIDRKNKQGGGYNNHDGDWGGGHPDQHLQLKQELSSQVSVWLQQDQLPPQKFPGNRGGTLAVGEPGDQFNDDVPSSTTTSNWINDPREIFVITVSRRTTVGRSLRPTGVEVMGDCSYTVKPI
ncbi:DEAD box ATP-dependent RNA helicase [Culex quinquefasciatus]|uniref:DEAD box ATP-dependent RNA helicase n=1 Tax=Culex quinquefasciatus TaxID=7176 RepID=B0X133_CULQU|nr:DEAD box ATP-dependent RNA helicase [Culex quinquefasciatus]|eukprot:XP_001863355.1 DEAD box ATP-dependent RNA helicase [Culex quinquefasciatus]